MIVRSRKAADVAAARRDNGCCGTSYALIHEFRGGEAPGRDLGQGTCYIEFGKGRVGSVDIDFLVAEKELCGSSRRARWFGT